MIASRRFLVFASAVGLALFGLHAAPVNSEENKGTTSPAQQQQRQVLDRGKTGVIEPGVTNVVKNTSAPTPQPPAPPPAFQPNGFSPNGPPNGFQGGRAGQPGIGTRLDVGKSVRIEPRIERLVAAAAPAPAVPAKNDFVNPKVEPGKVRWHKTFEEASAAAVKSKKPVMVFHLMGKLDDQFC